MRRSTAIALVVGVLLGTFYGVCWTHRDSAAATNDEAMFEHMAKLIGDEARVKEFSLHICTGRHPPEKECTVYIRSVWGWDVSAERPRPEWRKALTEAMDRFEESKDKTDEAVPE